MRMKDHVFIEGLEISARIGTSDEERRHPQLLTVHLRLFFPLQPAGQSDSLGDTVDYASIAKEIKDIGSRNVFHLVESFAELVALNALNHHVVDSVWVRVEKRALPDTKCVGVEIWREKNRSA